MPQKRTHSKDLPPGVYRHGRGFRQRVYVGPDKRPAWRTFKARDVDSFYKEWTEHMRAIAPGDCYCDLCGERFIRGLKARYCIQCAKILARYSNLSASKKSVGALSDVYVAGLLTKYSSLESSQIPQELIEAKRIQLKIKRYLKEHPE